MSPKTTKKKVSIKTRGMALIQNPSINKGTAFTEEERQTLGLQGLLPPRIHSQAEQVNRVMENFKKKPTDLERYIFMIALQDRNETLFFRVVMDNLDADDADPLYADGWLGLPAIRAYFPPSLAVCIFPSKTRETY